MNFKVVKGRIPTKDEINPAENKRVFGFLSKPTNKIITAIKNKHKKRSQTFVNSLLKYFPDIYCRYERTQDDPEIKCHLMLIRLLDDLDEYCKICAFEGKRELSPQNSMCNRCFLRYLEYFYEFCLNCSYNSSSCCQIVKEIIENKFRHNSLNYRYPRAEEAYSIFANFNHLQYKQIPENYFMFNAVFSFPNENSTEEIQLHLSELHEKLIMFANKWIDFPKEFSKRELIENAIKIIAFHYMFFYYLANKDSKYPNSSFVEKDSQLSAGEDYIDTGILLGDAVFKGKLTINDINQITNKNINENQVINYKRKKIQLNNQQISLLIDKIKDLYEYPGLVNVTLGETEEIHKKGINKLIKAKILRRQPTTVMRNKEIKNEITTDYIHYRIITKFLGLILSIQNTRFTNKIPKVFTNDNLMKLWQQFPHYKDYLDERHMKRLSDLSLKGACKKVNMKYNTTHAALENHFKNHPQHDEIIKCKNYADFKTYDKYKWILMSSSKKDIQDWIGNVNSLKK